MSVPVLSVHSTFMAPKFWIELRRLTMTFLRDIAIAPLARLTVTIIGSISGVRPTATATANSSASSQLPLVRPLITKTSGRHHHDETEHQPGKPVDALVEAREHALLGNFVGDQAEGGARAGEHDDAAADAADDGTAHEADVGKIKRRFRGPTWAVATFSSGIASPVSVDWLRKRSFAEISLRSAGIMSPADSRTISPGTSCSIGTSTWSCASAPVCRRTVAVIDTIRCSLSAALLERCSWMKLSEMLRTHHDGDHDRGSLIAQEVGRGRKREQKQVQRVDRAADELAENCMSRLVSDSIQSRRTEPLLDLVGREARRGAGKSLQCIVGRKAGDFAQDFSARGRSFGCLGRLAPTTSKDGRYCYWLIHEPIASVSLFSPRGSSGFTGRPVSPL